MFSHEIEKYDPSSGELIAWVRIPLLSASVDTVIYMYYGNGNISTSRENPQEVWDAGYKGVWHLSEDVTDEATGGIHVDSTSNLNYGAQNNNSTASAPIHTGQYFDGSGDYIGIPDSSSLKFSVNDFTVSLWVKLNYTDTNQFLVNKYPGGGAPGFHLDVIASSGVLRVMEHGDTYVDFSVFGTLPVNNGSWHYLTYVRRGTTRELWVDDASALSETHAVDNIDTNAEMMIGRYTTGAWTDGVIDELRISNTARSADWIRTSYNNQNSLDPSSTTKT